MFFLAIPAYLFSYGLLPRLQSPAATEIS